MRVRVLPWCEIPEYWPKVSRWIEDALRRGAFDWTIQDVYNVVLTRRAKLWIAEDGKGPKAAAVVRLDDAPRKRICTIWLVGGENLEDWFHFEADISAWAKSMGCGALEGAGRRGWKKTTEKLGWKEIWTVFRKEL